MALNPSAARDILRSCKVNATTPPDFHTLDSSTVAALVDRIAESGYRAPRNRNGSAARYFYEYLCRLSARPE